jgi:hypothetical protein
VRTDVSIFDQNPLGDNKKLLFASGMDDSGAVANFDPLALLKSFEKRFASCLSLDTFAVQIFERSIN